MIDQVGRFRFQRRIVLANAGDDRLDSLLPELSGTPLRPAIEQLASVGLGRILPAPRGDDGGQPIQGCMAHASGS